jgi:hypothetical protein
VLGPYSESDPAVLAQHFAWLREAGVGVIISSWWGRGDYTDKALPLMLDIADHYGIKIAFHIEPYGGRSAADLAYDVQYLVDKYGNHPAFFWTTDTSLYSPDDRKKALFFIWASVTPDSNSTVVSPDYWRETLDALHNADPGAIVLTDQNDPIWITQGHFDGSYKYGVLDADQTGYTWALSLPPNAWYVPGINPGFSARRIGYEAWVDTPRKNGETYNDRWERMFAIGVEPKMVVVTTFNEWHEGTQIEPAQSGVTTPSGYIYLDYEKLDSDGYIRLTHDWADKFLAYEWPVSTSMRIRLQTTSDWTDFYLLKGASWYSPTVVSTNAEDVDAGMIDGHLSMNQPLEKAEAGSVAEAVVDLQIRNLEESDTIVFKIERGGLGATTVEIYCPSDGDWVQTESFTWSGHSGDDRNAASFNFAKEAILCKSD